MPKSRQSKKQVPNDKSLDLIYEVARERSLQQLGLVNALSQKLNFILAFNGVVTAAIISYAENNRSVLIFVSAALMIASMIVLLVGLRTRKYRSDPLIESFYDRYSDAHPDEIKRQLISQWGDGVEQNKERFSWTRKILLTAISLAILGLITFGMGVLLGDNLTYRGIIIWVIHLSLS